MTPDKILEWLVQDYIELDGESRPLFNIDKAEALKQLEMFYGAEILKLAYENNKGCMNCNDMPLFIEAVEKRFNQ